MNTVRKKDGFASQKLLVLPDYVLQEIAGNELVRPLYVTDIGYFPKARYHYRERREGCDTWIFIFCAEGEGWYAIGDGAVRPVAAGSLIVLPAGVPHTYGASDHDPWSIYWFHLKGRHVPEFIRSFDFAEAPLPIPLSAAAKLPELFGQCYHMLAEKPYSLPHHIFAVQTIRYLLSLIGLAAEQVRRESRGELHLDRAIRYMAERLHTSVNLPELARHAGVSKQHLNHLFKKETGRPPIDYFLRMKMQRAGQLLDLTDLSVKAVAASLGIDDPYYFSRLFKKVMGVSPSEYRKIPKG